MRARIVLIVSIVFIGACTESHKPSDTDRFASAHAVTPGALTLAAADGDLSQVRELLAQGANVNENAGQEELSLTPLLAALANSHEDVAILLIENGASPYASYKGFSASDFAEKQGLARALVAITRARK